MGIENIDFLKPDEFPGTKVRERKAVSQHIIINGPTQIDGQWMDIKAVFGWDQPLQSFYLQIHNANVENPDDNPVVWLGATAETKMYEVEELVRAAARYKVEIPSTEQVMLFGEKDDGV